MHPHTFTLPIRPAEIPKQLLELPHDEIVEFQIQKGDVSGRTGGVTSAAELVALFQEAITKTVGGWLTLNEAGSLLEIGGHGSARVWVGKWVASAKAGKLDLFEPHMLGKLPLTTRDRGVEVPRDIRPFYDWVHVGDLNAWLEANEPHLAFRFGPKPAALSGTAAPKASMKHRIGRDVLSPLLEKVQRGLELPYDTASVMAELERLARLPDAERPAPLVGVNSGGVQWRDGGATKSLTRRALGDRLRRGRGAL